jgi:hypothetical protein
MTNPDPFRTYLQELQRNLSTGSATEHTHRSALQALLEALGDGVQAINEPQRVECGAPDYIFTYQKIVMALKETMRLMEEIDEMIPAWPIE